MNRKFILSLGTLIGVTTPVIAVVACGAVSPEKQAVDDYIKNLKTTYATSKTTVEANTVVTTTPPVEGITAELLGITIPAATDGVTIAISATKVDNVTGVITITISATKGTESNKVEGITVTGYKLPA